MRLRTRRRIGSTALMSLALLAAGHTRAQAAPEPTPPPAPELAPLPDGQRDFEPLGTYPFKCSHFRGFGHGKMKGAFVVVAPECEKRRGTSTPPLPRHQGEERRGERFSRIESVERYCLS